jgi:hypothetical protein
MAGMKSSKTASARLSERTLHSLRSTRNREVVSKRRTISQHRSNLIGPERVKDIVARSGYYAPAD